MFVDSGDVVATGASRSSAESGAGDVDPVAGGVSVDAGVGDVVVRATSVAGVTGAAATACRRMFEAGSAVLEAGAAGLTCAGVPVGDALSG